MSERRGRQTQNRGHGEGSRKRSNKKQSVMGDSNQTVEDRRQLRRDQRTLKGKVIEQQLEIADPNMDTMEKLTNENAELFIKTKFPREAVQDGETMKLIAVAAAQQVKMVSNGAVGVNIEDFFAKVRTVFGGGDNDGVNWARIGANYSMVYLSAPAGGGFMLGPLDKPAKGPRAQSKRRKLIDDDTAEVQPETMKNAGGNKKARQTKDQTQTRIADMRAHEENKDDKGTKKDLFETLLNPKSFTQTVENLFDFSFFVKNTEAGIVMNKETGLPQVTFDGQSGGVEDNLAIPNQWLMSFTPADFRELKELYGLTESNFPHRNEGLTSDYYDPLVHGPRESNRQ